MHNICIAHQMWDARESTYIRCVSRIGFSLSFAAIYYVSSCSVRTFILLKMNLNREENRNKMGASMKYKEAKELIKLPKMEMGFEKNCIQHIFCYLIASKKDKDLIR